MLSRTRLSTSPFLIMLMRIGHYLLLLSLGLLLAACEQAAINTPTPTIITLAGATAMQPVLHDLTEEFSRQHPNVLFNWLGGSSTTGETRLRDQQIDLAASTLLPSPNPSTTVSVQTPTVFTRIPIGLDGLAIIVHPSNKIENLSVIQLHDLFNGRVLDWAALGGTPGEVLLVSREDGSGSRQLFEERIMGKDAVALTAVVMPSSADVVNYVAQNPGAIGYVSRAYVLDALAAATSAPATPVQPTATSANSHPAVHVVQLEHQLPTVDAIKAQAYLLTQPLYLLSRGQPQGWSRTFVDFVLSPAGQAIVEHYHARVR